MELVDVVAVVAVVAVAIGMGEDTVLHGHLFNMV